MPIWSAATGAFGKAPVFFNVHSRQKTHGRDQGATVNAGLGWTSSLVILHLPTVCAEGMLKVLVELSKVTLMVVGAVAQSLTILKLTPETVPANTPGPVPVGVNVQGRPSNTGTAHRPPPDTVAPVIDALAPLAATVPVNVMPQFTGAFSEAGELTEIVLAGVLNAAPAGEMVAALAIEAAPRQTVRAESDTRVFKLFIVVSSHVMASHFAGGNGHEREITLMLQNFSSQPNSSATATYSACVIQPP
jgi:hypothetical protein